MIKEIPHTHNIDVDPRENLKHYKSELKTIMSTRIDSETYFLELAMTLMNVSSCYSHLEEPILSMKYKKRALRIVERFEDKYSEYCAYVLQNIGNLYQKNIYKYKVENSSARSQIAEENAILYYRKACAAFEKLPDYLNNLMYICNLGRMYIFIATNSIEHRERYIEKFELIEEYIEKILTEKTKNSPGSLPSERPCEYC